MPSPEEYRRRAKEARKEANACRNEYERQGLLIIADQCERIATYKDLTGRVTAPAQPEPQSHPAVVQPGANRAADGNPNGPQNSWAQTLEAFI